MMSAAIVQKKVQSDQDMEEWFADVNGLPAAWPDLSMIGSDNMKKVTTRDLQDIRARYQVTSMWGTISPNSGRARL